MASAHISFVLISGSWHKSECFEKVVNLLRDEHDFRCVSVTLPSTKGDPLASFEDDVNAARAVITGELSAGRNVIVVAHSFGGITGSSAIKGLTETSKSQKGAVKVIALVLIASGFAITGMAFMDPLFGIPPPSWRVNKKSGFAELVDDPKKLFYHDLPADEAQHWVEQLTFQSLKALFEGGEYVYSGWQDVPTWFIGTIQDKSLPVILQRVQIGMLRGQGSDVVHYELESSHSPFLSMPREVVEVLLEAVAVAGTKSQSHGGQALVEERKKGTVTIPLVSLFAPLSWLRYGVPFGFGRLAGWMISGVRKLRQIWSRT